MDRHEQPIDVDELQGWDAASPPVGFSRRVAEAWHFKTTVPDAISFRRGGWRAPRWAFAALVAASVLLLFVLRSSGGVATIGSLDAVVRRSAALGDRAVAVAEAGASLHWAVDRTGSAKIRQVAGSVFYRVDPGGPFLVDTPAGTVEVTGTCFKVEVIVDTNGTKLKSMALGAGLSAAVLVTVYEGGVTLATDDSRVELEAGQRGSADSVHGARRLDGSGPSSNRDAPLVAAAAKHPQEARASRVPSDIGVAKRTDLVRLQQENHQQKARIAELEEKLDQRDKPTDPKERALQCARRPDNTCPFVEPNPDTLKEMARCRMLRADTPMFLQDERLPARFSSDWEEEAGLTDGETKTMEAAGERFRDEYRETLEHIYVAGGGAQAEVEGVGIATLESLLWDLFDRGETSAAFRLVANERAGLATPPANLQQRPLPEQMVRAITGVGDQFETAVAAALSPERARDLRLLRDGWSGGRSTWGRGCDD